MGARPREQENTGRLHHKVHELWPVHLHKAKQTYRRENGDVPSSARPQAQLHVPGKERKAMPCPRDTAAADDTPSASPAHDL